MDTVKGEIRIKHPSGGGYETTVVVEGEVYTNHGVDGFVHREVDSLGNYVGGYTLSDRRTGLALVHTDKKKQIGSCIKELIKEKGEDEFWSKLNNVESVEEFKNTDNYRPFDSDEPRKEMQKRNQMYSELYKLLGFKPPVDGFMSSLCGYITLDVIRLDDRLKVPDGQSLADYIKANYGERAEYLTGKLIK